MAQANVLIAMGEDILINFSLHGMSVSKLKVIKDDAIGNNNVV